MILVNAAGVGIKFMAGKADPFITKGIEHTAYFKNLVVELEKITSLAAQGSKSVQKLFNNAAQIRGVNFAFNILKKYVPGVATATEVAVEVGKTVVGVDKGVLTAEDFLVKISGTLGFLRQSLKLGGGFASSYSDNLGICHITTGLINQLDYFEVKSYFDEVPPNTDKRNSLRPRYCALLQKRFPTNKKICDEIQ
jgi:hypothetical protein